MVQCHPGLEVEHRAVDLEAGRIGASEGDGVGSQGVIRDRDVGHLGAGGGGGVFCQAGGLVVQNYSRRCFVDVSDRQGVIGAQRRADAAVGHVYRDRIAGFALVVQCHARFEIQHCAVDLEAARIGASKGDGVGSQGVIRDRDVGHLGAGGGGGVFCQAGGLVVQNYSRRCFVDVSDRQGVIGAQRRADAAVGHVYRDRIAGFALVVQCHARFEIQHCAVDLEAARIGASKGDGVGSQRIVSDGDVGHLDSAGGGGLDDGVVGQRAGQGEAGGGLVGGRSRPTRAGARNCGCD